MAQQQKESAPLKLATPAQLNAALSQVKQRLEEDDSTADEEIDAHASVLVTYASSRYAVGDCCDGHVAQLAGQTYAHAGYRPEDVLFTGLLVERQSEIVDEAVEVIEDNEDPEGPETAPRQPETAASRNLADEALARSLAGPLAEA